MDINRIEATHRKERQKDTLQHLDSQFYQDADDLLAELCQEREQLAEQVDDPFSSREIQQLTDEIETVEETIESLYDRRMGKLVKAASFEAAGMGADIEATTVEERELFDSLVDELVSTREHVLTRLEASKSRDSNADADAETEPSGTQADARGEQSNPQEGDTGQQEGQTSQASREDCEWDVPRMTVQITTDVGEIFGVDEREYYLHEDDVVTLPEQNASALVDKDAAEAIQ